MPDRAYNHPFIPPLTTVVAVRTPEASGGDENHLHRTRLTVCAITLCLFVI
jgi:hypothetical protein